jgi:hypothetical protein
VTILCSRSPHRGAAKNLRLRSMVCAARHLLPRVMLLSKVWGKRRVSTCASLHHCHWDWHSGRICTVVFITRSGEWDSFRPNALNVQRQRLAACDPVFSFRVSRAKLIHLPKAFQKTTARPCPRGQYRAMSFSKLSIGDFSEVSGNDTRAKISRCGAS